MKRRSIDVESQNRERERERERERDSRKGSSAQAFAFSSRPSDPKVGTAARAAARPAGPPVALPAADHRADRRAARSSECSQHQAHCNTTGSTSRRLNGSSKQFDPTFVMEGFRSRERPQRNARRRHQFRGVDSGQLCCVSQQPTLRAPAKAHVRRSFFDGCEVCVYARLVTSGPPNRFQLAPLPSSPLTWTPGGLS